MDLSVTRETLINKFKQVAPCFWSKITSVGSGVVTFETEHIYTITNNTNAKYHLICEIPMDHVIFKSGNKITNISPTDAIPFIKFELICYLDKFNRYKDNLD